MSDRNTSDRRKKSKEKLENILDLPISKLKTQKEVINHLNGIWEQMKTGLGSGQEKDPERVNQVKKEIALRLLMPSLGATRMGSMLDRYPQILTVTFAQATANAFTEEQVPLAINRLSVSRNKAWVVEILKVFPSTVISQYLNPVPSADAVLEEFWQISTSRLGALAFTDPTTFACMRRGNVVTVETLVGFQTTFIEEWTPYDLQSGGHGFLVGTDSIFVSYDSVNFTGIVGPVFKIHYRFTEVGLAEYVGMVEGQQEA